MRAVILALVLGLQPRHIDGRWAFGLAGLAAHAQVERAADLGRVEGDGARDRGAEDVGAAAGAQAFVARGPEGRAHRAGELAAGGGAVAQFHGAVEALLVAEVQHGRERYGVVRRPEAQVFGHSRRADDVARVEEVVRIEDRLDLFEQAVQLGAEELGVEPAAQAAIAMLARKDAAVLAQQTAGIGDDLRQLGDVRAELGVEQRVDVQTPGAGVREVGDVVAKRFSAVGFELRNVVGQVLRRHRSVVDDRQRLDVAAHAHEDAEAGVAHLPHDIDGIGLVHVRDRLHGHAAFRKVRREPTLLSHDLVRGLAVELGDQDAVGVALDERLGQLRVLRRMFDELEPVSIDQFDGRRVQLEHHGHRVERGPQPGEVHDRKTRHLRHVHQVERDLGDDAQRAFRAADDLGQVEARVVRPAEGEALAVGQAIEVVAAAASPVTRRARADDLEVGGVAHERQHTSVDLGLETRPGLQRDEFVLRTRCEFDARPVRQDDLGGQQMIGGHAIEDRVRARGVVAHDAAERGAATARRIRPELEAERLEVRVQRAERDTGLGANPLLFAIDLDDLVEVPGQIDDQRFVDGLAGEAGAAAARQDRHAMSGSERHGLLHVVDGAWDEDAVRTDLIDAGIRAVEDARDVIRQHIPQHTLAQLGEERVDPILVCHTWLPPAPPVVSVLEMIIHLQMAVGVRHSAHHRRSRSNHLGPQLRYTPGTTKRHAGAGVHPAERVRKRTDRSNLTGNAGGGNHQRMSRALPRGRVFYFGWLDERHSSIGRDRRQWRSA